ncbi:response regulator transcription factor [Microbacterium istanbulense]|uniref:Response regulator transcription factor n=1 Tax=Microbacterium istanbulense TaxID=3122049 RepID=A0ABU8LJW5_9MICO
MTAPVRVLVVDDQTLVRQGIRSLLSLTPEAVVVGEAADGEEALDILATEDIDVVLLDLRMPVRDGIATLKAMHERGQAVPTLVLTTFDDDALVLGALRAGAKGYMLKDVSLEQLLGGIRTLHSGGTLLQPALTERLLRAVSATQTTRAAMPAEELSPRELDVLRLAAGGLSNRQIARGLFLAEGTVKNHMSSVLLKLGVTDRTKAVLRALETGILSPDEKQ